jgi:hypothetical protein
MGNTTNSIVDIDDYIDLSIKNIIDEQCAMLKSGKLWFSDEWEYQREFVKKLTSILKKEYPSNVIRSIIEYHEFNFYLDNNKKIEKDEKGHRIDIVLIIDDKYYPIELKYSFYYRGKDGNNVCVAGTELYSVLYKKEKEYSGYIVDIIDIQNLVNEFDIIKCGYCILLTSNGSSEIVKILENPKGGCLTNFDINDFPNLEVKQKVHKHYDYYIKKINKTGQ